jgi:hypothetical protein
MVLTQWTLLEPQWMAVLLMARGASWRKKFSPARNSTNNGYLMRHALAIINKALLLAMAMLGSVMVGRRLDRVRRDV